MYKIAAFIKFNKNFEKKVLYQKQKIKKKFGKQIYLDHPVHLTLFTLNIKKLSSLRQIYNNEHYLKNKKNLNININGTGIFPNDTLTNGHTLFYKLKKNLLLRSIQMLHLKKINKEIYVSKKKSNKIDNNILKENYKKYGFMFSGKIWIPHITVASIRKISQNHSFIKNFLKLKINTIINVDYVEFYKIVNEKHIFLFKTKVIQ